MTDSENYNCIVTTETGKEIRVFANEIHNLDLDHWQGWNCNAGATRFYIDKNFDIWSGECKNDQLGNVLTAWETKNNTVCNRKRCTGCTDDLMTKKEINYENSNSK